MTQQLLAALCCALWFTTVGCGGGSSSPTTPTTGLPDPGLSLVTTENANAREATIGPEGGTFSVTGSNGVQYTLTIPENALLESTTIRLYPLSAVSFVGGAPIRAGVQYLPDGLQFRLPATMTMTFPTGVDPSRLGRATWQGNLTDARLGLAIPDGQSLTISVPHFSGDALLDPDIIEAMIGDAFVEVNEDAQQNTVEWYEAMLAFHARKAARDGTDPRPAFETILRNYYKNLVRDQLVRGSPADASLEQFTGARLAAGGWYTAFQFARAIAQNLGPVTNFLAPEVTEFRELAGKAIERHFTYFNFECEAFAANSISSPVDSNPLSLALIALEALEFARQLDIPPASIGLDSATLLGRFCLKVIIESRSFPDGIKKGEAGKLRVKAALRIGPDVTRREIPLKVQFTRDGKATGSPALVELDTEGIGETTITWPNDVNKLTIGMMVSLNFKQKPFTSLNSVRRFTSLSSEGEFKIPKFAEKSWTGKSISKLDSTIRLDFDTSMVDDGILIGNFTGPDFGSVTAHLALNDKNRFDGSRAIFKINQATDPLVCIETSVILQHVNILPGEQVWDRFDLVDFRGLPDEPCFNDSFNLITEVSGPGTS